MLRLVDAPSGNPLWGITRASVNAAANASVNANPGATVNANAGQNTESEGPIQFYVIKVTQ